MLDEASDPPRAVLLHLPSGLCCCWPLPLARMAGDALVGEAVGALVLSAGPVGAVAGRSTIAGMRANTVGG